MIVYQEGGTLRRHTAGEREFVFGRCEGPNFAARPIAADSLTPFFQSRPNLGKGSEFCASANEYGDLTLQRIGIVGGLPHVLHVFKVGLQDLAPVIQNNQAIPRIAARAPQKISLVAAERRRQSVAAPKKINGARLPVVLRENTAARPFFGRKSAVSLIHSGYHFFPTELIGEVLGEDRTHVAVLASRDLERQLFHVGNELLHGENGHNNRCKPRSSCKNQRDKRGLQPDLP